MKKVLIIIFVLFAALTISCSKEETNGRSIAEQGFINCFTAYVPSDESTSKTYLDAEGNIHWNKDDRISVFRSQTNERWIFCGETGDVVNVFKKDDESEQAESAFSHNYAVYPYSTSNASSSEGTINVTLPGEQDYAENSFAMGANIMVAVTKNSADTVLMFKNVCGFLQLKLFGSRVVKSLRLYGNSGEKLSGSGTIACNYGGYPSMTMGSDAVKEVTLNCGEKGVTLSDDSSNPTSFYIAIPPVTFSKGFSIEITDADGNSLVKTTNKSVTVSRSAVKPMAAFHFAPKIVSINGTKILEGNNIVGLVSDKTSGQGIEGVPVTDGYTYTLTDKNGVYQMAGDYRCRFVYYSLPPAYETTMDSNNCPCFYSTGTIYPDEVNRNDFVLTPKDRDESNWTLIGISDPQPSSEAQVQRYKNETVSDIISTMNTCQAAGKFANVYAVTLGDVAYNQPALYPSLKTSMSNVQLSSGRYIPFYQCNGNHDWNGSPKTLDSYLEAFGPSDYSFNVGEAHIVVMNNIVLPYYTCGLTDTQFNWLRQDLNQVPNKESKLLIFCVHAPFGEGKGDIDHVHKNNHYDDILKLFTKFHDAHVISGHTHAMTNYILSNYICQSGRPIYDHNQNAACGWMWSYGNTSGEGSPEGYAIYDIRGNEIYDWVSKGACKDLDFQMRVYDGNQTYTDKNGTKYSWYDKSTTSYAYSAFQNCFVVNLWNCDDKYWEVELYVDGQKVGELTNATNSALDVCAIAARNGALASGYACVQPRNLWYIAAPGGDPAAVKNWEIRATQTIPSSTHKQNVYSCTKLQTDFTGF